MRARRAAPRLPLTLGAPSPTARRRAAGFTKLSEKLQKDYGRKGSEYLNAYVNAYFAKLIDGINKFAGDVIKFAGDALQVVWRNRPDGA